MRIALLCTDTEHPVNAHLERWIGSNRAEHEISLVRSKVELVGGELLFLISSSEIVERRYRDKFSYCLVLHASALPRGRGWSPHVWEIIAGASELTLTLLEAEDRVDTGRIWGQIAIPIAKHALHDEINDLLFDAELQLMDFALRTFGEIAPRPQAPGLEPTYYRKRTPEDSRIDPDRSISSQFDLLRVCDPRRYPAFFEVDGHKYRIKIEKCNES